MSLPNRAFLRSSEALWKSRHSYRQRKLERYRARESHWFHHWDALRENRPADDPHRVAAWHDYEDAREKVAKWEKLRDEASRWLKRRREQLERYRKATRPREVVRMNVRNQSSRGGVKPRIIVVHSTESSNRGGTSDLRAIGNWFDNPAASASSHVCTDAEGNCARYVPDERKAWHCARYNSVSLGIEQVGRAAQNDWGPEQERATARYLAFWSRKYGIPLRHSTSHGVCRHSDLGAAGGGHFDPGSGYDLDRVLDLARSYAS